MTSVYFIHWWIVTIQQHDYEWDRCFKEDSKVAVMIDSEVVSYYLLSFVASAGDNKMNVINFINDYKTTCQ